MTRARDRSLLERGLFGSVSTIDTAAGKAVRLERSNRGADAINAAIFSRLIGNAIAAYRHCISAALLVNDSTDYQIFAMPFGGT